MTDAPQHDAPLSRPAQGQGQTRYSDATKVVDALVVEYLRARGYISAATDVEWQSKLALNVKMLSDEASRGNWYLVAKVIQSFVLPASAVKGQGKELEDDPFSAHRKELDDASKDPKTKNILRIVREASVQDKLISSGLLGVDTIRLFTALGGTAEELAALANIAPSDSFPVHVNQQRLENFRKSARASLIGAIVQHPALSACTSLPALPIKLDQIVLPTVSMYLAMSVSAPASAPAPAPAQLSSPVTLASPTSVHHSVGPANVRGVFAQTPPPSSAAPVVTLTDAARGAGYSEASYALSPRSTSGQEAVASSSSSVSAAASAAVATFVPVSPGAATRIVMASITPAATAVPLADVAAAAPATTASSLPKVTTTASSTTSSAQKRPAGPEQRAAAPQPKKPRASQYLSHKADKTVMDMAMKLYKTGGGAIVAKDAIMITFADAPHPK